MSWKMGLTIIFIMAWLAVFGWLRWDQFSCLLSSSKFSILFWGYAFILATSMVLFAQWVWKRIHDSYFVSWFRPKTKRWDTALDWDDVKMILDGDPLNDFCGFRGTHLGRRIYDLVKVVGVVLVISLFGYWTPTYLVEDGLEMSSLPLPDGSGTFLISVVTIAVTLIIALRQLQAKVRSENRQKWIDDVRNTLAKTISEIPDAIYESSRPSPDTDLSSTEFGYTKDVQASRIKLELLMNPSEIDHRTLGWLLRRAYGIREVKPDKKIPTDDFFANINKLDRDERSERNELISYIIRLSNAILKREWERVKRGK